jgi:hypothetical protein
MKTAVKYFFGIALVFIVASRATGAGTLITDTFNGASNLQRTLQGR